MQTSFENQKAQLSETLETKQAEVANLDQELQEAIAQAAAEEEARRKAAEEAQRKAQEEAAARRLLHQIKAHLPARRVHLPARTAIKIKHHLETAHPAEEAQAAVQRELLPQ